MEHLHAYWRMEYIEGPKYPDGRNPFLELPKMDDDRAALIVQRSTHTYLVLNRYPYNAGHLLAIPYREVANLDDLDGEERLDLMNQLVIGTDLLKKALHPDAFNIGINLGEKAGAGIPSHLHFHIVPRWGGDTNFMPVIGKTRVLPESLDAMWQRIMDVQQEA